MWQICLAIGGAWCIAIGAAAQEQPATAANGGPVAGIASLAPLLRNGRWLAGAALTLAGVAAHLIALSAAPVTIVQPLGVSGLLVAVWLAARWRGRGLTTVELAGAAAVTAGLAGLVATLPHRGDPPVHIDTIVLSAMCAIAGLSAGAAALAASRLRPTVRAWLLAATAGTCFGVASALARVIGARMYQDPTAWWHWTAPVALALLAAGGMLLQNAYRTGRFGLAYATLLISDPVVAAATGAGVLGEPLPTSTWAITAAIAATVLTAAGVVALARGGPATRPDSIATRSDTAQGERP